MRAWVCCRRVNDKGCHYCNESVAVSNFFGRVILFQADCNIATWAAAHSRRLKVLSIDSININYNRIFNCDAFTEAMMGHVVKAFIKVHGLIKSMFGSNSSVVSPQFRFNNGAFRRGTTRRHDCKANTKWQVFGKKSRLFICGWCRCEMFDKQPNNAFISSRCIHSHKVVWVISNQRWGCLTCVGCWKPAFLLFTCFSFLFLFFFLYHF